ncbi:MAG: putative nucleotide-diphospho-sugar transferase, partial [Treponema sp.]|nr:putative nucleotide-diphospho-sugar transferase [Treponema sp.]
MNIAYILISTPKDTFYEQTAVSVMTLRKAMPNANVYILVDEDTKSTFKDKRTILEKYNVNIITVDVPTKFNNRDRSRFIKTSMNKYLPDNFIFIDSDTIICDNFNSLNTNIDIGMVLNRHMKTSESPVKEFFEKNAKDLGWHHSFDDKHFNSGFMSVRGSEKSDALFKLWHELWQESRLKTNGTVFDQTSLNEANYRLNGAITEIDGIWNCQINRNCRCMPYIHDAKILHLYTNKKMYAHDMAKNEIIRSVLEDEHPELDKILANPKA